MMTMWSQLNFAPRLPLTVNLELFRAMARFGSELTALRLLESPKLAQPITAFIGDGIAEVGRLALIGNTFGSTPPFAYGELLRGPAKAGFTGVRESVSNCHIGGYQLREKQLKDRKRRTLRRMTSLTTTRSFLPSPRQSG